MGSLQWRREALGSPQGPVLAVDVEGPAAGVPGGQDDLGALAVAAEGRLGVDPEQVVRGLQEAPADAVLQPPAGEHVNHGVLLGQAKRVVERDERDAGADPDAGGAGARPPWP